MRLPSSPPPLRILYVEDDADLGDAMRDMLGHENIEVEVVPDGRTALARLVMLDGGVDLVLVDLGLPDVSGFTLCRELRLTTSIPIMIVTGDDDLELRIRALEECADDFMLQPFDRRELVARIRAHVRRARGEVLPARQQLQNGPLVLDLPNRAVTIRGIPITVTSTELAVLAALAQYAGQPVTREYLLHVIHGTDDAAFDRSIDVLISRLRSKLELDPRDPALIKTVRGHGYMLVVRRS